MDVLEKIKTIEEKVLGNKNSKKVEPSAEIIQLPGPIP